MSARRLVEPFLGVSFGLLRFAQAVPLAAGSRVNFTGDFGGGLRVGRGWLGGVTGYRFHHLSNGGTAATNPAVDSHLVYVGVVHLSH